MTDAPYKVGIVGESNYQAAIGRCQVGDAVTIAHEMGNPYDRLALAVLSKDSEKIGFIAKSSWLRTAIHDEQQGCDATIAMIAPSESGVLAVVLDVTLNDDGVPTTTHR